MHQSTPSDFGARLAHDRRRPAGRRRGGPVFAALLSTALSLAPSAPAAGSDETQASTPTDAVRAAYWIDRLLKGPEPTAFAIPSFHKTLLLDAQLNLVALGAVTLERLADPDLVERVQRQEDTNPWHAILEVLARLAPRRPEIGRAWAVPAIRADALTLRRAAIDVFEAMRSPADGPVLLDALARNGDDRLLGPRLSGLLLRFGAPWDGLAARTLYERAAGDRPDGASGLWTSLAAVASDAPDRARPDLLAWWGLLCETAGPRAPEPATLGMATGRSIDPAHMAVVASPHALTSGRLAAAEARFALARQGNAIAVRQVTADLDAPDPALRELARRLAERPVATTGREAARASAAAHVAALRGSAPPTPDEVASVGRTLRSDESPEALRLLEDLFRELPKVPAWKVALLDVFDGLVVRGGDLVDAMQRLLADGGDDAVDLAFVLMRRSGGPAFIPIIETWLSTPAAASRRFRARRELAFLYVSRRVHNELDAATAAAFAAKVRGWIEDPEDPSGAGLVSVLLELGAPGEAELAGALAGPRRATFVEGVASESDRYVGVAVVEALLAPVDRRTPREERRRLLAIVFRLGSGAAADALEALAPRLTDEGRADVSTVVRIVRHRIR